VAKWELKYQSATIGSKPLRFIDAGALRLTKKLDAI
jgi:hypothetical protein